MGTKLLAEGRAAGAWSPKVACAVTLTLVFLCGAAAGAVAMDMGLHSRLHPTFNTASGRALVFERMQRELNLTPAQSEQIELILDDFWQYYRTVLSDSKSRIDQLLTDDQRVKFEHLLQERQK
jgi:hypothetical protein